ncbi:phosphatidylinositol transfer protein csr1, partial [Kickxella alabastrina]
FAQKPEGLLKFIDKKELLESRGGKDKYVYDYVKPAADENKLMFDAEGRAAAASTLENLQKQFIEATTEWTRAKEEGDHDKLAKAAARRMEVSDLVKPAAMEKDKFTRARHFYTRTGVLQDGIVDWTKVQVYDGDSDSEGTVGSK